MTTINEEVVATAVDKPRSRSGVVVVQRHAGESHMGQGLAKGHMVVIKHFFASLLKRNNSRDQISGMFTVEYPEEVLSLPETYRNMPILLYDDETGHELCTSCFQCERVCPPQVIHITQEKNPDTGKPVPAAAEFVVEYDSCMSCGYCAEVCPFDAIKMDHYFELSTANHLAMDVHKEALNRPVSYYATIAPNLWAEVRDTAMKKLGNNVKRRPGTIGVAPQALGKVAGSPTAKVAPGAAAGAQAPASAQPAGARRPVAATGKNMPPEKLERLEAIRAANRAKSGGTVGPVTPGTEVRSAGTPQEALPTDAGSHHQQQIQRPEEPIASTGPAQGAEGPAAAPGTAGAGESAGDDKQARLAAIRAANRARQENQEQGAPEAPQQSAAQQEPEQPPPSAAPDANTPDDKKARLEAIRAANRAKQQDQEGS